MGARTGEEYLKGLRRTDRELWLGDERVDDVTHAPRPGRRGPGPGRCLRPPARVRRRVPDARPGDRGARQRQPHDPPQQGGPAAAAPRAGPHRREHGRADGPHARLHERDVRRLRGGARRLGGTGGPQRGGRRQPAVVPEATGSRGPLADPHHHPPDHRPVEGQHLRRQPGAAPQGGRHGARDRRPRRAHPRHAGTVRRRDRRLPRPSPPSGRARHLRAQLLHPRQHARAGVPLP